MNFDTRHAKIFQRGYNQAIDGKADRAKKTLNALPMLQLVDGANAIVVPLAQLGSAHRTITEDNIRRAARSLGGDAPRGFECVTGEHQAVLEAVRTMFLESEVDRDGDLWVDCSAFKSGWRRDSVSRALVQMTFMSQSLCLTRGVPRSRVKV